MLTRDEVVLGFRLIFGRDPESERTVEYHRNHPTVAEFGRVLRESEEFRTQAARTRAAGGQRQCWIRTELPSGLSLWVDLHDDGVSAGILRGAWEPAETNFILSVVKPGDSVIDVGANLGWYTVSLAQALGPDGHVFAFEPRSDIFAWLERSVRENGLSDRCTLCRIALGARKGQCNLAWSPIEMNQGHTFIVADDAGRTPELKYESVRVTTLDDTGIARRIRLIKLDAEGSEHEILRGGRSLIARDQPIIVSEAFPKWLLRTGETDIYSLLHALDDLDYRAHYLTDDGIGGEVRWPVADLESDYVYYSVAFLGAADRAGLLDGRRDGRVAEMMRSEEQIRQQAKLAEERTAALVADVRRLTDELAAAKACTRELSLVRDDAKLAHGRAATLTADVERLTRDLAAAEANVHVAERRARIAEFRNLEAAGKALRMTGPASGNRLRTLEAELAAAQNLIDALHRSTSWRVTAPLRAVRRIFR